MAKLYPIPPSHHHDEVYIKKGEGGVTVHGNLTGLDANDHPQYLLTTGKAADSNKLDGQPASYYLSTTGKAADSNKLNGQLGSYYLSTTGKAADSNKLDGLDSTDFGRPVFLTSPKASASWMIGVAKSSTSATTINLNSVFGVPKNVKAILFRLVAKDSAALHNTGLYIALGPTTTYFYACSVHPPGGGVQVATSGIIPCDSNGNIAYTIAASGTNTFNVDLQIWGYWL